MNAFIAKDNGFYSLEEFHQLVADVDLSSNDKIEAFEKWRNDDGTKKGVLPLLSLESLLKQDLGGKLNALIKLCKAEVSLTTNPHKSSYETVEVYFKSLMGYKAMEEDDIEPDVLKKMIEINVIIELTFYPDTPIGSYSIYHHDLEMAVDEALKIIKK